MPNIAKGGLPQTVCFHPAPSRVDLPFSTVVNKLRFLTTDKPGSRKASPCKLRVTVQGPASIRDYFIAEPAPVGKSIDCVNAQRVTFNGASNLKLGPNESATSDVIEWAPTVSTGIMLSFATDASASLSTTLDPRCLVYFKRGTNEAGQLKKSDGYTLVGNTCFALASFEVLSE